MSAAHSNDNEGPAERFARKARTEFGDFTERYAEWTRTAEGVRVMLHHSFLAMQLVLGVLSLDDYRKAMRELAATVTIPQRDFFVIAKGGLELTRCMLAGAGQVPFLPTQWPSRTLLVAGCDGCGDRGDEGNGGTQVVRGQGQG